ncbi:adenosylhomocysteine nucleosidase [Carnobacterium iners]|uniref:adenosylhomocysteine nucleosidase n=1 Tax=Carnobacterium iners TaxID=1073423 RepID=A0A1X7NP00_9LACT|nr:5'-methylthioadenosine/adenosylhomocysteine nucleosidase [Carnobacterium iners]SEK29085.1 adenosylhomocysteine nucleosidase [Carnobacterium iners]SMH39797.1 adenosylhomocysteine nucleosidase [Carnobacterium iners]
MRIAIIAAMAEEVRPLKEKLKNKKTIIVANAVFEQGLLNGHDVVLVQSRIGKANAAMSTAILVERFAPDFILNTGSAGAMDHSLSIGDIVISTESIFSDVDATVFNYALGQVPEMPASYHVEEKYSKLALTVFADLDTNQNIIEGLILTADSFMSDKERVRKIRKQFPTAKAAEMEGAAIHQTAHHYGIPFINIRILSDIAGENAGENFEENLDSVAETVMLFVEKFTDQLVELNK